MDVSERSTSASSTSRSRLLNKGVTDLFGHARGTCRVCNAGVPDRRYKYCSPKCRQVAYAVVKLYRWRAVRDRVLERDGYECVRCGATNDLEADHVQPLARGGAPLDEANLQTLCGTCNREKGTAVADYRDLPAGATGRGAVEEQLGFVDGDVQSGRPRVRGDEYPALSGRVLAPERFFPRGCYDSGGLELDTSPRSSADSVADDPPDELAQYVVDAIDRQDVAGLEAVVDYASDLLEAKRWDRQEQLDKIFVDVMLADPENRTVSPDDVVERLERHGGSLSERMVECGRSCSGCPHGPYLYHAYHDDVLDERVRDCLGRLG